MPLGVSSLLTAREAGVSHCSVYSRPAGPRASHVRHAWWEGLQVPATTSALHELYRSNSVARQVILPAETSPQQERPNFYVAFFFVTVKAFSKEEGTRVAAP